MSKYSPSFTEKVQSHKKVPIWLPYLNSIEHLGGETYRFSYNGGVEECELSEIHSILIYGDYGSLNTAILESIVRKGIPIILHKRNVAPPIYICIPFRHAKHDLLTKQILARSSPARCAYIARQILRAKFKSMSWLVRPPTIPAKVFSLNELRLIEAKHSKTYWRRFFRELGLKAWRRNRSNIQASLDACSKFLIGIILRWVTYHHLSPYHGFLHASPEYPALCYDLIEPYRGEFDKLLFKMFSKTKKLETNKTLVGAAINTLKEALNEKVYCGLTRQVVTRHELLHGVVLSLRCYLLGQMSRFLVPTVDKPNGGRPRKVAFRLYGRHAGRTNFWPEVKKLVSQTES